MGGGGARTNPPGWLRVHVGQCTWGRACGSARGGSCARVGSLPALPPVVRHPCAQARGSDMPPLGLRVAPGGSHSLREPRVPPVMGNGGRGERGGRARTPENRRVCPPPIRVHHPCHSCMHPPHGQMGEERGGAHPRVLPFSRAPPSHSLAPPSCSRAHPLPFARTPCRSCMPPPPVRMHPPAPRGRLHVLPFMCTPSPPLMHAPPTPVMGKQGERGGAPTCPPVRMHAPPSGSRECPSPCSHPERGCTQRMGGGRRKEGKGGCRWWHLHPLPPFSCRGLERGNAGE
jgi:hypothetical protein